MKLKQYQIKVFWRIIPYFSLSASTALFFWLAYLVMVHVMWNNWLLSISANLASVFFIYFLYETIKAKSEKELKKELFIYAKSDVDKDIFSIINNLSKFFYGFQRGRVLSETFKLLKLTPQDLERLILNRKFIGFELFKSWDEIYEYFSKILENHFVLNRLNDDQILVLLHIRNALISLKMAFNKKESFRKTGEKVTNYATVSAHNVDPRNKDYPNRYILLRMLDDNKSVVEDFGDFSAFDVDTLLDVYIIEKEAVEPLVIWTYDIFRYIKRWLELTGDSLHIGY